MVIGGGGSGGFDPWDASILHLAWTGRRTTGRRTESWLLDGAAVSGGTVDS